MDKVTRSSRESIAGIAIVKVDGWRGGYPISFTIAKCGDRVGTRVSSIMGDDLDLIG